MATDIKISEFNEITSNRSRNYAIVNDRETDDDAGTTRKVRITNFHPTGSDAVIGSDQLKNSTYFSGSEAVNTTNIRDLAVTNAKLASGAVTSSKIGTGAVGTTNIADDAITGDKIDSTTDITASTITAGTTTTTSLVATGTTTINGKTYTWPASYIGNKYLKVDGNGNLSWDSETAIAATPIVVSEVTPVGTILPWAGGSAPTGYLLCNGGTFDSGDYPELATLLGDQFGTHSGSTYYLPNLQGRTVVGAGTSTDDNAVEETFTLNDTGGEFEHILTISEIPSHTHIMFYKNSDVTGTGHTPIDSIAQYCANSAGYGSYGDYNAAQSPSNATPNIGKVLETGSGSAHTNLQPWIALNYIIKATPDPTQTFTLTLGDGIAKSGGGTIDLDGGTIYADVDTTTVEINGSNKISVNLDNIVDDSTIEVTSNQFNVKDAGISAAKLDGAQTGSAPIFGIRAWVSFDATRNAAGGSDTADTARYIIGSGNITSVTKTATGTFTVAFTTSLPSATYVVTGTGNNGTIGSSTVISANTKATSTCSIWTYDPSNDTALNASENSLYIIG